MKKTDLKSVLNETPATARKTPAQTLTKTTATKKKRATYCTMMDADILAQLKTYCMLTGISIARYTEEIINDNLQKDIAKLSADDKAIFQRLLDRKG